MVMGPVQDLYERNKQLLAQSSVAFRKGQGALARSLMQQVKLLSTMPL